MARFDYFDSFRGILCLSVMIFHLGLETYTLHGFHFGVIGFFVLSAFLLTYRLIKQYESANSILTILKLTVNYAIMRFFRIYIPYIIYFTIFKYVFKKEQTKNKKSFLNAIMLDLWGRVIHLWTMPIEIRYYFLIPIIAFVSVKFYKNKMIVWSLFLLNLIFLSSINKYKLFSIGEDLENSRFSRYLPIFMSGSILAIVYLNLQETKWIEKLNQNNIYKYSMWIPCVYVFWYLCRAHAWYGTIRNDAYLYSAGINLFMFLLLISPSNFMADYLSKETLLKLYGKYSYGIYLFHYDILDCLQPLKLIITDRVVYLHIFALFAGMLFYYIVENNLMIIARYLIIFINERLSGYKPLKIRQEEINV